MLSLVLALLAQDSVKVDASVLNVRSGPGTGYAVIGQVTSGQSYVRVASSGSWRKIWYDHRTGWVHSSYLSASSAPERRVTASSLNVRSGPGTGYADVGDAPGGSWWSVVGESGSWRKVFFAGTARWMNAGYLSSSGGTSGGGGLPTSYVGYVQMPASGPGYYSYTSSTRRWGQPRLVYNLITACKKWDEHHDWPRMGMGDISDYNGGYLSGHASHQLGVDVDIRPVASTGYEGPLTRWSSIYSSYRTKHWITDHVKTNLNVKVIFYNDPMITPLSYVTTWPNHDNHMHVRVW